MFTYALPQQPCVAVQHSIVQSVFVEPALSAFEDGYNRVYPVMRLPLVPVRDKFQQLYLLVQYRRSIEAQASDQDLLFIDLPIFNDGLPLGICSKCCRLYAHRVLGES